MVLCGSGPLAISSVPACGPWGFVENSSGRGTEWRACCLGAQKVGCSSPLGPRPLLPVKVLGPCPFASMEHPVNKRRRGGGPGGLAPRRPRRPGPAPILAPVVVISSDEEEAEAARRGEKARLEVEEARKAAELLYRCAGDDLALDRRRVEAAAAQRVEEARMVDEAKQASEARKAEEADEAAEVRSPALGAAAAWTGSGAQSSSWRSPDPFSALPRYGGIPVVQLGLAEESLAEEAGEEETQSDPDTAVDEACAAPWRPLRWRPEPCQACGVLLLAPAVPCWCAACTPAARAAAARAHGGGCS